MDGQLGLRRKQRRQTLTTKPGHAANLYRVGSKHQRAPILDHLALLANQLGAPPGEGHYNLDGVDSRYFILV